MANTYRALSERALAIHGADVFEAEFAATEERDHLSGGHLEIVPRPYKVLSARYGPGQGKTFDGAFPVEQEAALISGGHIERVNPASTTKKKGDA